MCFFCLVFFFFKQKTAYEMRISDWSSDVCSSDLILVGVGAGIRVARLGAVEARREVLVVGVLVLLCRLGTVVTAERRARVGLVSPVARAVPGLGEGATPARRAGVVVVGVVQEIEQRRGVAHLQAPRSEERGVGKECVSQCRAR